MQVLDAIYRLNFLGDPLKNLRLDVGRDVGLLADWDPENVEPSPAADEGSWKRIKEVRERPCCLAARS